MFLVMLAISTNSMKGQSEIAYLPKFADVYVKLKLEFLIASPISYILSFWSLL